MRAATLVLMMSFATVASAQELTPQQITQAYKWCTDQAFAKCSAFTTYCDGYRHSFLKVCLVNAGVPPDYIMMLLN